MKRFSLFIVAIVSIVTVLPGLAPAADTRYAQQLASESDALIRDAIRRPYGWAWDAAAAPESAGQAAHAAPRPVTMETLGSPGAGLVLLWSGRLLNQPRYVHASQEVARAIAASQTSLGLIRSHPVFGPSAGGRDEPSVIPDRQASRAALGLLLALTEQPEAPATQATSAEKSSIESRNNAIRSSAIRAAAWLAKQQTPNGLWPSTFASPADPKDITRIVRFDDADYRDSTLALILAADVLGQDSLRLQAKRPVEWLLKVRLTQDTHGPNLWPTAVTPDGTDIPKDFASGPDVLASRINMQTLLADYLFTGNRDVGMALDAAATTLREVKRPDGLYDRFLDPTTAADLARANGQAPATQSVFAPAPTTAPSHSALATLSDPLLVGSFSVNEQLDAVARLKPIGRDRYLAMLSAGFTFHQHLSATLTGMNENPLTLDFPVTDAEVPAYITAHAEQWRVIEGPLPPDLAGRVRRLWVLLIRTRLEAMTAQ